MEVRTKLTIRQDHQWESIHFGLSPTEEELESIYRLRYDVYSDLGYIDPDEFPDGKERDEYDAKDNTLYFFAKFRGEIIATIRAIQDRPLPTRKYFSFEEPEEVKKIPPHQRRELGRLIIVPPERADGYLPRGLVMLVLFYTMANYGKENEVEGGYAFIKKKLERIMRKRKNPFRRIQNYEPAYSRDNVLYRYFTQEDNPAVPIYYLTDEFYRYTRRRVRNPIVFKRKGEREFLLRKRVFKALRTIGLV